jgi:hypothetical protein
MSGPRSPSDALLVVGPFAKLAAVAAVAGGFAAAHGVAAPASSPAGAGGFGAPTPQHVRVRPIEVQLTGGTGTLRRVPCAPGARPGTACYLAPGA